MHAIYTPKSKSDTAQAHLQKILGYHSRTHAQSFSTLHSLIPRPAQQSHGTQSLHLPLLDGRNIAPRILPNKYPTPTPIATAPITHLPAHIPRSPHLPQHLLLIRHLPRMLIPGNPSVIAVVILKRVRFFAVNGVIPDFAHFIRHAQGDAADEFDEHHNKGGPDDVPADDEEGADNLEADLAAVACDGAARVGDAEGGAALFGGPET